MAVPLKTRLRGIRASIPQGYVLGRASKGVGEVEVIPAGSTAVGQVPRGGTTGQVLTKRSNADFDVDFETPASGGTFPFNPPTPTLLSTAVDDAGGVPTITYNAAIAYSLSKPSNGGFSIGFRGQAMPGVPWTMTARMNLMFFDASGCVAGLSLTDGTKLYILGAYNTADVGLLKANSVTSFNSNVAQGTITQKGPLWCQIQDDGVNHIFRIGPDGVSWTVAATINRTAFMTVTSIGLAALAGGAGGTFPTPTAILGCDYFKVTTP